MTESTFRADIDKSDLSIIKTYETLLPLPPSPQYNFENAVNFNVSFKMGSIKLNIIYLPCSE